ncbi:MAG: RNase P subunit p30 family protein [Candidatus Bathyarchaeia archaeon]
MRKAFVDLHLRPPIEQADKVRSLLEKSASLGYSVVGLTFPAEADKGSIENMRKICSDVGLDLVSRVDLVPKNAKELLRTLCSVRWRFEVVAVYCNSREVALQAAKDRRVDLLLFSPSEAGRHFFGPSEAKLASEKGAALEVNLAPLLYLEGRARISMLSVLRREVSIANSFNVSIVLSSGATSPSMLRRPEDYAFLSYLIGLDLNYAKKALSDNPISIVERNRRKLSQNYVCPGVFIVKRGEDC